MTDDTLSPLSRASIWEQNLYSHLAEHAKREVQLLEGYLEAAEDSDSKAFAFVVGLLVEDERRHHRHFADLAASLRNDVDVSPDDPAIPRLDFHRSDREKVLAQTRTLIANEKADRDELKQLRKELRDLKDTTLWALLVETMQLDTEKHLAILNFVEKQAASKS